MSLFEYTYTNGTTVSRDILEDPENIAELIFVRNKDRFAADKIRPHESHPVHEAVAKSIPPNVRILRAIGCKLRTFPVLPTNIHECYLSSNHFLELPDLSAHPELIVLELDDNSIASVDHPLPPALVRLNLECNALRRFNKLQVPPSCVNIMTGSNPYDPYKVEVRRVVNGSAPTAKAYLNGQNVHDTGIQNSTKANILYIVNYKPEIQPCADLWNDINKTCSPYRIGSVLESYAKNPYIMHGVTFEKLVDRIWLRIKDTVNTETRSELITRFIEEVKEGNGHCKNGMMVRLVNVFVGFDEHIVIKLNANQVLAERIPATMKRLRKSMNLEPEVETDEFCLACYKETIKDLEDLEVGKVIIDGVEILDTTQYAQWLLPLIEQILDKIFIENGWHLLSKSKRPPLRPAVDDKPGPTSVSEILMKAGLNAYVWEIDYILEKWRTMVD